MIDQFSAISRNLVGQFHEVLGPLHINQLKLRLPGRFKGHVHCPRDVSANMLKENVDMSGLQVQIVTRDDFRKKLLLPGIVINTKMVLNYSSIANGHCEYFVRSLSPSSFMTTLALTFV